MVEIGDMTVLDPVFAFGRSRGQGLTQSIFGFDGLCVRSIKLGEVVPSAGVIGFKGDA